MKRIAIVGCGGINSWVCKYLNEIIDIFDKKELIYVKLFDNDEVEEKNLLRSNQNFVVKDLLQQKSETLGKRYGFDFENIFITEENISVLNNFDDIILGVDNNKVRRLLYNYCLEKGKYLIDMRAQGTQMAFYVLDLNKKIEDYDKTLFANKDVNERKGSCQLTQDIENDHIENGNKIIGHFGIYGIYMKHLRNEDISTNEWKFAY